MITINLIIFAILIVLTAFFVASEFAIVKLRSSRVDQLVAEGKKGANAVKTVTTHLDEYLSACQLGITITALGLGWLGEPTVAKILEPLFEELGVAASLTHILSFIIAFALVTFVHVVVGELAPKTFAIQKAETVTLLFARPLILFYKIMFPFIWLLNGSARLLTGMFGLKPASEHELAHSEEELRIILSESFKGGEINQSEYKYVNNIFEFDNRVAREIMVPRTEISAVSEDDSIEDFLKLAVEDRYTRYPVTVDGDKDNIIGLVNVKEILNDVVINDALKKQSVKLYMNPIIQVIETVAIQDLLRSMQKKRTHMAVLIDEYGGTAGIVTVEDILEEIVGEIRDEFDTDEKPLVQKISDQHFVFNSKVLLEEVNEVLHIEIENDDIDTIGGWMLMQNIDIQEGESFKLFGYEFIAKEMDGHQMKEVEVRALPEEERMQPESHSPEQEVTQA
ncbi:MULTISPECIES: hemolysin family protein [Priestia]|uniref:hemolysin family protein n=1 Tax=Priestia TaxID=2800373 RepID=UPI00064F4CFF|nr:hemolysin family protein [Priestia aryabhattai]KML28369.1 membrane protein [Priestia aryabhattai]KMO01626.1 membrane protein [Priestia aryabhattai]NLR42305.1 HlyC/CorC family transporter [Priestia megaterium]